MEVVTSMRMGGFSIQPATIALLAVSFTLTDATAQRIAAIENLGSLAARLEPQPGDKPLSCEIQPLRPVLNFGFRFQAGYVFRIPMSLYDGARHRWVVLTRIVPEDANAQTAYLIANGRLPSGPRTTKVKAEAGGTFWLGEGRYNVTWVLLDDQGRVCRKEWRMEAALARSDRKIRLTVPPNTVAQLSWKGFSDPDHPPDSAAPARLTVLMDAAPRRVRRTSQANLNSGDQLQLLGALSELLRDIPSPAVRLVVFSLEQQKELFRRDDFHLQDLDQVSDALNGLTLGRIDSGVLRNPGGRVRLLSGLLNEEIHEPRRSDFVIVLGPEERFTDKIPAETLDRAPPRSGPELSDEAPRFFYLQCKPAPRLVFTGFDLSQSPSGGQASVFSLDSGSGNSSDLIRSAMKRLQGETLTVYTPGQFAKAVERIKREASPHP